MDAIGMAHFYSYMNFIQADHVKKSMIGIQKREKLIDHVSESSIVKWLSITSTDKHIFAKRIQFFRSALIIEL